MRNKKTSLEIKESILEQLRSYPKTVAEISELINSNWITTEKFLKELSTENKVRELVSTEKKKVYQLITGDTYFDIPIDEKQRKRFRTLFSLILQEYKERKKNLTKTHLAKVAVSVIRNEESELSDLPTIWYLYGMIPLMVVDPSQDYKEEISFENRDKIKSLIGDYIKKYGNDSSRQAQVKQHREFNEELYMLSDEFLNAMNENKLEKDRILKILNEFFIATPIDNEFKEVFEFTDRFISTIQKLAEFSELSEHRREINSTFEALWKYIATYKVYKSILLQKIFPNSKMLLDFYIGNILEARRMCFLESFSEIHSVYLNKLKDSKLNLSDQAKKARDIMEGWTGED